MHPLPKNHVRLYNKLEVIETLVPYATEDATELNHFPFCLFRKNGSDTSKPGCTVWGA